MPRDLPADSVLSLDRASAEGRFSATEVARGDIANRLPEWFNRTYRVDRVMQDNLDVAVETLMEMEPGGMFSRISSSRILSMARPPQPVRPRVSGRDVCHWVTWSLWENSCGG